MDIAVLSNNFICKSKGESRLLALINNKCTAFRACSAMCFFIFMKLPDLNSKVPKYLYLSRYLDCVLIYLKSKSINISCIKYYYVVFFIIIDLDFPHLKRFVKSIKNFLKIFLITVKK